MAAPNAIVVETPERVALSLDIADLGHRILAFLVDAFILFFFWVFALTLAGRIRPYLYEDFLGLSSLVRAIVIAGVFVGNWAYDIGFETLRNGQTPGKRLLGIRVVRDDGSPVTFFESVARNVCRIVDFPMMYGVGVLAMMASPRSKRLGDHVAGTCVVRDRSIDLSRYAAQSTVDTPLTRLTPEEFELVSRFLERAPTLEAPARTRLLMKLAEPIAARLPETDRARVLQSPEACEAFLRRLAGVERPT